MGAFSASSYLVHDCDFCCYDSFDVSDDDDYIEEVDDPVFLAGRGFARRERFEGRGERCSSSVSSSTARRRHPPALLDITIASYVMVAVPSNKMSSSNTRLLHHPQIVSFRKISLALPHIGTPSTTAGVIIPFYPLVSQTLLFTSETLIIR